jgi:hypothetical protein
MRQSRTQANLVALLVFVSLLCSLSFAQTANTGALTGQVTDATGAVVGDVQITVTNEATGEKRAAVSQRDGTYSVPLLAPDSYRVEFSRNGFKTAAKPRLKINVTETARLNIQLEVGAVKEEVTVTAQAELMQTDSAALGQVTSGAQINTLPLVNRNYTQIVALNPGVSAEVTDSRDLGRGNLGNGGMPIVSNGVSQSDNNVQMNGVGINDLQSSGFFSGGVAIPNPDTIEEFKVQTGQYDAAYGRNAGANVNLLTKGGSNDFHGAVWEFLRNDALNANTFFRNSVRQPRPVLKQNQFGFDFGGPVKTNKLFFFTSYQGTRQRNGLDASCSSQVTTPALTNDRSAAALGALFSGKKGALGGVAIAPDGSNINPVALKLLQLKGANGQFVIPTPQKVDPTQPFEAQGISAFSVACPFNEDQFMTNGDWQISEKSKLAARFFFANSDTAFTLPGPNLGGGSPPGFPVNLTAQFRNASLTHTYTFSPHLLNQVVLAYNRTFSIFDQSKLFSFADIGATVPSFDNTIPAIAIDFGTTTGLSLGGNGQTIQIVQNNFTLQDSVSWTRGRHNFRFGGGVIREQLNQVGFHFLAGELFLSWPDFLLGLDGAHSGTGLSNLFGSIDLPGLFDRGYRVLEANTYAQDDIKLTSRLTVNLGLRYDRLGDLGDIKGRNSSFDFSKANPNPPPGPLGTLQGTVVPSNFSGTIPAGVTQIDNEFGIKGNGQNTWNPRVGFAWQLPYTNRFVLRGGYGVYHSRYTGQPFIQLLTAPPFAQLRQLVLGANTAASEQQPFPLATPAFPNFVPYTQTSSNAITVFAPDFRPPMIQEYSLGIQSELTKDTVLEIGYSGARGTHLIRERSVNQAGIASASNPIRTVTTNTRANVGLRVPFQGFSPSVAQEIESAGSSWYNALLVGLNKRFSHGLRVQGSYTFAKSLATDASTSTGPNGGTAIGNQNDPSQRYGPDTFIRRHRLIANYTYDLPGPRDNGALKQALGGWTVAGVTTLQSGQNLTPTLTNALSVFGITTDRPSVSGSCTPSQYVNSSSPNHFNNYINPACFTKPAVFNAADDALGTGFGNAGIGIIEGPGQFNWDLGVMKKFAFAWPREGAGMEFRTDFFNAFNHTQFANPSLSFPIGCNPSVPSTCGTFGRITNTSVGPRVIQFALKLKY